MTNYYLLEDGIITQSADFKFSENCLETQDEILRDELSGQLYFQSDYNNLIVTDAYKAKVSETQKNLQKATLQQQIKELEQKQFRSAKAKFALSTDENDLTYYNNYESQINALREQINALDI